MPANAMVAPNQPMANARRKIAKENGDRNSAAISFHSFKTVLAQYNATGLPGEPVAPFIFSGDQTNRNS